MKTTYILIGVIATVAIVLIALAWYKREELEKWLNKPETKELIKDLCRQAEKYIIGTKQGLARLEWVVAMLYEYVPPRLKKYFTIEMAKSFLIKAINIIFDQIAVVMRDGSRRAI